LLTVSHARAAPRLPQADAETWRITARLALERGEYQEAIVDLSSRLGRPGVPERNKLEMLRLEALLYWYSDQGREADECLSGALRLADALGLKEAAASLRETSRLQSSFARARDSMAKGDTSASNAGFEEAWQHAQAEEGRPYQPKILRAWSFNYYGHGNPSRDYRDLNARSVGAALSLNYLKEASRAARNIGAYDTIKNNLSSALSWHLRALSYVRNLKAPAEIVRCLNNIASVHAALGDYVKAKDDLMEGRKLIGPEIGGSVGSSLLINLGQTFLSLARSCRWTEYYGQALDCYAAYLDLLRLAGVRDIDLSALNGIAAIDIDLGRLAEAKSVLAPAVERLATDRTSALAGMTLLNAAEIAMKTGEIDQAERLYGQALAGAKQRGDDLRLIRALTGLGRCAERRGQVDQAVAFYDEAVRVVADRGSSIASDADRAEFIRCSREPCQALMELYYRLSRGGRSAAFEREIFRVSESYRARSFIEQIERRAQAPKSARPEVAAPEKERLTAERLDLLRALARGAESQDRGRAEELESRLRHLDAMLDAAAFEDNFRDNLSPIAAPAVPLGILQGSILPDRTALIEYVLGDERSFLMCVTRDAFRIAALPPARALDDSITGYLSFLEDPSIPAGDGLAAARRLYSELVQPAVGVLPGDVSRLIIVPDGILFRLPFEALAVDVSGDGTVRLNDRYSVSYSPSASALYYLRRAPRGPYPKQALAVGISSYGALDGRPEKLDMATAASVLNDLYKRNGFAIGPIPWARAEVEDLAGRLPPAAVDAFYGADATEAAFKRLDLRAYRLIHLACHAFSDERYPLRSALVFAAGGEGDEDGFLEVPELSGMRTAADLVVLSACQTGRGRIVQSEGILGLPRVFLAMGARSVIATLWPVQDKAGAIFMRYFYDAYFRGADKAEALRTAKRKMAGTRYAHPYYWASYTLTGES
jgi:CHAT domain-containing protein/tetratricopeptide (TPR) repeat protein